ncbi:hypothetical protein, partial [Stenotrophomonas maltophilia]
TFDSLLAGLDRSRDDVLAKLDALVSAHDHRGKAAFDGREAELRASVSNLLASLDPLKHVAVAIAGLPAVPVQTEVPVAPKSVKARTG